MMEGLPTIASATSVLFLTASLFFGYFLLMWIFGKKHQNLPPGPRGWRDNLDFMKATFNGTLHDLAAEWAKKYGELTFINCMGNRVMFLNSARVTRKMLGSDDYKLKVGGRRVRATGHIGLYAEKGFLFNQYDGIHKKKRRMFFKIMELYGDGVEKFENIIQDETDRLLKELDMHGNQDFDITRSLARSLKNIMYILALGERPSDPSKADILEEFDIAVNKLLEPEYDYFLTEFPLLSKLSAKHRAGVDRLLKAKKAAKELVYDIPKKTCVPGSPRGMADLLFEWTDKPGYEWMADDHDHIIGFLLTIFFAGHITSRASLLAAFLCLINYPDVAKKIHEEIDNVIGDRRPRVEDKADMPYTSAFILELLRVVTQVSLGALRFTDADFEFEGMTIPKGTEIMINGWYFHHDEKIWEDPWTLKPERFLSSNGQLLPADDPVRKNLLPFGAGVRSCPGEVFARTRVFLVMTNILQKYDLLPPANEKLTPADFRTTGDSVRGFVRQIQPYKCRLTRRHKVGV